MSGRAKMLAAQESWQELEAAVTGGSLALTVLSKNSTTNISQAASHANQGRFQASLCHFRAAPLVNRRTFFCREAVEGSLATPLDVVVGVLSCSIVRAAAQDFLMVPSPPSVPEPWALSTIIDVLTRRTRVGVGAAAVVISELFETCWTERHCTQHSLEGVPPSPRCS